MRDHKIRILLKLTYLFYKVFFCKQLRNYSDIHVLGCPISNVSSYVWCFIRQNWFPLVRQCHLQDAMGSTAYIASMCQSSVVNTQSQNIT